MKTLYDGKTKTVLLDEENTKYYPAEEKEKIYAQQDDINSYEKERILRSKRWRNDK